MPQSLLTWESLTLNLRNPFTVSYGTSDTRQAFWLRLTGDEGWGEGTLPPYYGVDTADIIAVWSRAAASSRPLPDDPAGIPAWVGDAGPAVARCALDLALHDRIGRQRRLPLHRLLGLPAPRPLPTSFTLSIDTPEAMAEAARSVPNLRVLKIKLGSDAQDVDRVAAVRAARPDVKLRVDANAGWQEADAIRYLKELERFDLEMVEQPLDKHDFDGMGRVQAHTALPIVADESAQTLADVERLGKAGVRGLNLKLMKTGGLTPALAMLKRARELGMRIMLGCMVETSLGTTAMAHLMGLADWVDLDAPLLIANDPFDGVSYGDGAVIRVPERAGIGVVLKP
ncbi:L-alanine-DL-glutamate epimerase [Longilinea arvoryzae]|uniref:Dipeptide epimerase n=1 Tax=Longilinea arvoryzae TaxID=360412 RepID=A0A0S7BFQ6_9CHLR|nr:dipeptide epimerase [Longilinea arvoryzae]GAP12298.1 L-alanine-DL-glutamate epimerase [Longilinea arvoryzae]